MTETGAARLHHGPPRAAPRRHELLRPRAEPFVETRIVDEKGIDVAVDVPGELLVRAAGAEPRDAISSSAT